MGIKEKMIEQLDVDKNNRVNLDDAKALLEREIAKRSPKVVATTSFAAGAVLGFMVGRASK